MFGKKSLLMRAFKIPVIFVLSIIFEQIFDNFFLNLNALSGYNHTDEFNLIDTISTILIFSLMLYTQLNRQRNVAIKLC